MKAVVVVPKGSKYKYEIEDGSLVLKDLVSFPYPVNYGVIPEAQLDVLIIGEEIIPLALVDIKVIGMITIYEKKMINKIVAVPKQNEIKSVNDLPNNLVKEIEHFSKDVIKWHGPEKAKLTIKEKWKK